MRASSYYYYCLKLKNAKNKLLNLFIFFLIADCFRLLVGAPLAQTPQPGVTRGGSVYRCSTELADQCEAIPFDVTGTVHSTQYTVQNTLSLSYT